MPFKRGYRVRLQSFLLLRGLGAINFPVFGKRERAFFYFLNGLFLFLAEFTADVDVTVFGAVDDKIEMTGVGSFVGFVANKLDVFALECRLTGRTKQDE